MPWKLPQPMPAWGDKEQTDFLREIWSRLKWGSFTWTPPAVNANTSTAFVAGASGPDIVTSSTVGLRSPMPVNVTPPAALARGVTLWAGCAASDTLTITVANNTGAPITPPSGTWCFEGVVL